MKAIFLLLSPVQGSIYVWNNKVAQFGLIQHDYIGIVTESPELAETQRALLTNLWEGL